MGYERYPRGNDQRGYESRDDATDYGRSYESDYYGGAAARDYGAGWSGQARRDEPRGYGGGTYGNDRDRWQGQGQGQRFGGEPDRSAYGAQARDPYRQQRGTFERRPQDPDRGFFDRAGDEVRSWFGDEDAERRREQDARRDEAAARGGYGRDEHYHNWRNQQIAAFDRDYDEYRRENQSRFHNEFSSWRTDRQGQRDLLGGVQEHATVVGSDGEHIGTVDKVRGDRIILTKSDSDAGGHHHSVPSRWLQSADGGTVTLRKTAAEAKAHWRDEERGGALFNERGDGDRARAETGTTNLNRSFSGTY